MKKCPVPDCDKTRADDQVCCKGHWFKIPKNLRDEIWAAYKAAPGSARHLAAIEAGLESLER